MLKQYHVFIGVIVFSLAAGNLEILPNHAGDRTFLENAKIELKCRYPTSTNKSSQLTFTSVDANITSFTQERQFDGTFSILTISSPHVTTDNEGTYTCRFEMSDKSVAIKIYKDTKEKEQHRFHDFSSNYITGESFTIECPILDSLMPTVTWSRDVSPELDTLGDRMTVEDIGNVIKNGRLTLKDLVTEDRGHYICRAEWYSGNATFKHLVRVKSNLAPLWPAIGIIVEVIILVLIVVLCKDRKKGDSVPLSSGAAPSTSGTKEKGNRRKYATSST